MHYSKEKPSFSTFRIITTNFLGVQIFRKFTVWTWCIHSYMQNHYQMDGKLSVQTTKPMFISWNSGNVWTWFLHTNPQGGHTIACLCNIMLPLTPIPPLTPSGINLKPWIYRNDSKFSDRQVWANSVDPDQTAPSSLIRVSTVGTSVCIF